MPRYIINRTVTETAIYNITDEEAVRIEAGDDLSDVLADYDAGMQEISVNHEEINWSAFYEADAA